MAKARQILDIINNESHTCTEQVNDLPIEDQGPQLIDK